MKAYICDICRKVIDRTGYGTYMYEYRVSVFNGPIRERKKVHICYGCNEFMKNRKRERKDV